MTTMIYDVIVHFYDGTYGIHTDTKSVFGLDNAIQYGLNAGVCDNVEQVDVVDTTTGEVVMEMEDGDIKWLRT